MKGEGSRSKWIKGVENGLKLMEMDKRDESA